MRVVGCDVGLSGMSQEPLDCERVSLGGVEPGGKRMPAPVGVALGTSISRIIA